MRRLCSSVLLAVACTQPPHRASEPSTTAPPSGDQAPVPINPVSPVEYPATLLAQEVEGRVLLRLHVDSAGTLSPDSSRIAESSGHPALDSAALAGARALRFSPALREGRPVALSFIQPILFRAPRARGTTP